MTRVADDPVGAAVPTTAARPAWRTLEIRVRSLDSVIAYSLIAAVVAWRSWASLRWSFQGDDWVWVAGAARTPFLSFVTAPYHGHLQPAQFAMVWVTTRLAPLSYPLAIAPLLLATLIGGVLMWRFLAALFGERRANLVPLAVFLLCPASLRPAFWLAGGLGLIPMQTLIVGLLFATLLYVRSPSAVRLFVVGLVYAGALLVWEKSLLILVLVALFVLLFLGEGTGRARVRSVLAGRWKLWAVLVGVTAPYVVWYARAVHSGIAARATASQALKYVGTALGSMVVPTYLGGPWSVLQNGGVTPLPRVARYSTWAVLGVIVLGSIVLRKQAWRAWLLPLSYLGLCLALVVFGRLSLIGPGLGLDTRYVADSVPVFALAIGLAFMTPRDRQGDPAWGWRRGQRGHRLIGEHARPAGRATRVRAYASGRVVVLVIVTAYAVSAMITGYRIADLAEANSLKTWLATVRSEIATHPRATVFDGYLPRQAFIYDPVGARLSNALAPITQGVAWDRPTERPLMFDPAGRLRPVEIKPVAMSLPGPVPNCGYLTGQAPIRIPLTRGVSQWPWGVQLGYFTDTEVDGWIMIDRDRQDVHFNSGVHSLTLLHAGPATTVSVWGGAELICVGWVRIGTTGTGAPAPRPLR